MITEIIDRIQAEFRCCGISSSHDYKRTRWRRFKLAQLSRRLNWSPKEAHSLELLQAVPLVPASCCRAASGGGNNSGAGKKAVLLDDSQVPKPPRVPAWSPSMVVETLPGAHLKRRKQPSNQQQQQQEELEEDSHSKESSSQEAWRYYDGSTNVNNYAGGQPSEDNSNNYEFGASKQQRRLLAKHNNFNVAAAAEETAGDDSGGGRRKRNIQSSQRDEEAAGGAWAVRASVDARGRVLAWLTAASSGKNRQQELVGGARSVFDDLAELRRLLLKRRVDSDNDDVYEPLEPADESLFKWPNRFQLSFEQYKLIEGFLLAGARAQRTKRSIFSVFTSNSGERQANLSEPAGRTSGGGGERARQLRAEVARRISEDPELACAPRGYLDSASIYTRGCQPFIRAWLDHSAHVLFVTGFCVLTVLKFCSLVLLRLEIREMIHKIRVLKGMATEYNALQDLEAYLPRPSVCAQAAELTPAGVAAALPTGSVGSGSALLAGAGALPAPLAGSSPAGAPPYRLGGSFSETVAAATAAAAATNAASGQLCASGLATSGRAASMKAMAAVSSMLTTPNFCTARSSSAHLCTGNLLGAGAKYACSLRSSDFLAQAASVMSRRHTAVSVCPAAAAAVATAAAQHLISRRGTYVPTAATNTPPAAPNQLNLSGLNLQHRHSAVAPFEYQFCSAPGSSLLTARSALPARRPSQLSQASEQRPENGPMEHQRSLEVAHQSSDSQHQLLSLVYPFKRQTSGGAQSACNFSLDLAPALSTESRRSIH